MQAELETCKLYYEVHGEGRPLVMLHGLRVDHRHMKGLFEPHFAQRPPWQRIYVDLPGMGQSNGEADRISSNDDMLAVILEFIDHVISGQRFSLAGTSYGAYMGRGVLHERQERIDGLCLLVPPILPRETRTVPQQAVASIPARGRIYSQRHGSFL